MISINHVYFDVGGVVLLDYSGTNKWEKMKRDLGVTPEQDYLFEQVWKQHRDRICLDYDVDDMVAEFEAVLNTKLPTDYSMLTDFVGRFEANPSIWPIIQAAKNHYSVGLLTNQYPRMLHAIMTKNLLPPVDWDIVIDSSVVGFQKPEEGIYQLAEKLAQVDPSTILFIDNSQPHLDAAAARGWHTLLYHPQQPERSNHQIAQTINLIP